MVPHPDLPAFHLAPDALTLGGAADRFHRNIAALSLARALSDGGRSATDAERLALAHYTAFGESALLNRLFRYDAAASRYVPLDQYAAILGADEARQLRRAALTAFYTPLDICHAIWGAVMRMGLGALDRPRVLEPAAGVGHFISTMPPALRARAEVAAVELDPTSARILGLIHPDVALHAGVGFEQAELPPAYFDLAISNVPFGELSVHDPLVPEALRRTLHDYFFARALRLVRPGGLVVFLTSWGTLDKRSRSARAHLAEQAELLGAFRLPNGLFQQISGSASAADLIVLQKKPRPAPASPPWLDAAEADLPRATAGRAMTIGSRYTREFPDAADLAEARVAVSRLWLDDPARVIGQPQVIAYDRSLWLQVAPPPGDLAAALDARLQATLPAGVVAPRAHEIPGAAPAGDARAPVAARRGGQLDISGLPAPDAARAAGLAEVYAATRALIRAELGDAPDAEVDAARAVLGRSYDGFVAQHGAIHDPRNRRALRGLPELQLLLALERGPRRLPSGRWAADRERIFTQRTLRPHRPAAPGSLSPAEALLRCLDERGALDIPHVARLAGLSAEEALAQLGDRVFQVPGAGGHALADAYLSGDVVAKLREARAWAAHDPALQRNVAALEAVQPTPLGPGEIALNLNAFWLPGDVVSAFIRSLLPAWSGEASYHAALGEWRISDPAGLGVGAVEATSRWGTPRADAMAILGASLRGVPATVYDVVAEGGRERRALNPAETVAAQEKQQAIARAFEGWAWADPARAGRLCALYNRRFNSVRMRRYDGGHLTLPGMDASALRGGDLAPYQKDAVWQILQSSSALLGFAVGGGKTFTAIAAAVEARRLGLCHKALAVVPNGLVGQWVAEARRLYPGVSVLAMAPEDFAQGRRGVVLSRVATGDWDLVVVAHSSFTLLPPGPELAAAFRDAETDRLRAYLEELRATADSREDKRSLKQIERAVNRLEQRLQSLIDATRHDSARAVSWGDLGVDMLIVDEAQAYKNLSVPTRLSNIGGLPSAHSQRALDMRLKTWDLLRRGGRVVFLTATPIMNTLGESYVMQLYLQEAQLAAAGIHHFDEWVSLYARPRMAFELKPDGSGFRMHTRLASFINLPELSSLWRQALAVRTKAQMGLPEPAMVTGGLIPVVVPASAGLAHYIRRLAARADAVRAGRVEPTVDNMLRIVGDGRKAALDIRLVAPQARRPRHSKVVALAERVARIHRDYAPLRAAQLVFCDLATPRGRGGDAGADGARPPQGGEAEGGEAAGSAAPQERETGEERAQRGLVYAEIRAELAARGVPAEEVAFIHDHDTRARRDALFAAVNDGRVRVLVGSTAKMGAGMNVQRRLVALHDLDCPWRPGDLEQRHGRILRQGNMFPEVYLFTYITEGSFDGYMWGTIEAKARFIEQALAGEITARTAEDTSEVVLSAAEIKAIASGNPQVARRVRLEAEVARMERVRGVWRDTLAGLRAERARADGRAASLEARRGVWGQAQLLADASAGATFCAEVAPGAGGDPQLFTSRADAGAALQEAATRLQAEAATARRTSQADVGSHRGFRLLLRAHPVFAPELSLATPDGATLESLGEPGEGAWARITRVLNAIPETIRGLGRSIAGERERVTAIDAELARLVDWDGQDAYDAAVAELALIAASFAEEEDRGHADQPAHAGDAPDGRSDLEIIIGLLEAEGEGCDAAPGPICIPPAPASLALVEAEAGRMAAARPPAITDAPPPPPATERRRPLPTPERGEALQQLRMF